MKKLSIIIPAYNVEEYIATCLDSLLDQELSTEDYEIIVINDGSTDKTLDIVSAYQKKADNIILINKKNEGISVARNVGIARAEGQYLYFVDSDDFLYRSRLGPILSQAISHDLDVIAFDYSRIMDNRGDEPENACPSALPIEVQNGIHYIESHFFYNMVWWYMVKRTYLLRLNLRFSPGRFYEDGIFTMKVLLNANRIAKLPIKVYCYVFRQGSVTTCYDLSHQQKLVDDFIFVIEELNQIIKMNASRMTSLCKERCIDRRNSYTFFLLIRMLKLRYDSKYIRQNVIDVFRSKGYYPFPRLLVTDYPGWKYTLLCKILNVPFFYFLCCKIYKLIK